jgi:hypothetical protein
MTPKRRAPRARRARVPPTSDGSHDSGIAALWAQKSAESERARVVELEDIHAKLGVVLEAVQGLVTKSEFNARLDATDQRLGRVEQELRALRQESTGYARAEDVRALERRVSALERSSA